MHLLLPPVRASVLFGAALLLAAGCSSSGKPAKQSTKAVEGLSTMRTRVIKAKDQINATVAAMNQLSGSRNLQSDYRTFAKALSDTESQAKRARSRVEEMNKRSSQYIAQWEKEMSQVSSPELRAAAEERRQRVRQNFDEVSTAAQSVREAYEPFIQDLRDINKTLGLDLTPAGVQSARPAINKANADAETLNQRLDDLIEDLDRVIGVMPSKK